MAGSGSPSGWGGPGWGGPQLPAGCPPLSPDFGDRVGPPPQTPPSHSHTPTVESTPGVQKTDHKKKRKHRRRADRVPLPKPLWTMKDPDAPFRAYTSDGRELTRADAERWQKRKLQEMVAFAKYGDPNAPLSPDEADVDITKEPPNHANSAHNPLRFNILPASHMGSIFYGDFRLSPRMFPIFYDQTGRGRGVHSATVESSQTTPSESSR